MNTVKAITSTAIVYQLKQFVTLHSLQENVHSGTIKESGFDVFVYEVRNRKNKNHASRK